MTPIIDRPEEQKMLWNQPLTFNTNQSCGSIANSTISRIGQMSKIIQISRLYSQSLSKLSIGEYTVVSRNTDQEYMATYDARRLTFEQINSLNDKELDDIFCMVKEPSITGPLIGPTAFFSILIKS